MLTGQSWPPPDRVRGGQVIVQGDWYKTPAVRGLLDRSGFAHRYLPAYSPDLNPIEPAWAKVKSELRRAGARTAEALHRALGPALDSVTARDASGFFRHAGCGCPE